MASNYTTATCSKKISLKIVVDAESHRVVFAEAGKDFVDFIFNISYLPVGTVMKLLAEQGGETEGCLGNIHKSIEDYGDSILHPALQKVDLLKPTVVTINTNDRQQLLNIKTTSSTFFQCSCCDSSLDVANPGSFVNGNLTYVVMDDLSVMPISAVCVINILKRYNVKSIGVLETREVYLGKDEALNLLKASMHSKTVLTDVFLRTQDDLIVEWLGTFGLFDANH